MQSLLIAGWLLAVHPALSQQTTPQPPPRTAEQELRRNAESLTAAVAARNTVTLTLAAPVTRTDVRVSGGSVRGLSQPFTYFVHGTSDLCGATTVSPIEPRAAAFGWRVTATALTGTTTQVVVKIDWQRLWERGRVFQTGHEDRRS